jgi:hypothetical protein
MRSLAFKARQSSPNQRGSLRPVINATVLKKPGVLNVEPHPFIT